MDNPENARLAPMPLRRKKTALFIVTGIAFGTGINVLLGRQSWHMIIAPILICFGGWLNYIVISANAMYMPVFPHRVSDRAGYVDGSDKTRYPWLCDRIPMGLGIGSVGDILCFLGILVVILELIHG